MKKFLYIVLVFVALVAGGVIGYVVRGATLSAPVATTSQTTTAGTPQTNPDNGSCSANDLTAKVVTPDGNAAAGSRYYDIVLTNSSTTSCTINGFPGVSLTDSTGAQIGSPADKDTATPAASLSLAPNEAAKTTVRLATAGNYPDGTCKDGATTVNLYPPGDTGYLSAPTDITTWCPGFTVTAMTKA